MAARKNKAAPRRAAAQVEAVEEVKTGGMNIDDGIVLTTFLLLAGAVALAYLALGNYPA